LITDHLPPHSTPTQVKAVVLDDGTVLEADVVAIGAGIIPATSFIKGGVNLASDQSIIVDEVR
jgi:NAD(P)H-nitrite reductase large subunit